MYRIIKSVLLCDRHLPFRILFSVVLLGQPAYLSFMCSPEKAGFKDILDLLPADYGSGSWNRVDESLQTAAGEALYDLINGGADLYLEYGFRKAAFAAYEGFGRILNVEIYQMDGDSAAYGINSLKKGAKWKAVDKGQEGYLSAYYLNFWKGSYQVSVIGMDSSESTMQGIMMLGDSIAGRIREEGRKPRIIRFQSRQRPLNAVYFKGPIALLNIQPYDTIRMFGSRDGLYQRFDGYELFIYRYADSADRAQKFIQAAGLIEKSGQTLDLRRSGNGASMRDETGMKWVMTVREHLVLVWRGRPERDHQADLQDFLEKL